MHPFAYTRTRDTREALGAGGRYLAGGTDLVTLMRAGVEHPDTVVDIAGLPLRGITGHGGLRIGALVTMAEAAAHPGIRDGYPVIAQALESGGPPQIRNVATVGGNLMQRTRCAYFRDVTVGECNKRAPGSGCAAVHGRNRGHAILGTSASCVATHPSDLAVALTALDASVHLDGPDGARTVPIDGFLLRPGSTPDREHALRPGELITAVEIPAHPGPLRSGYLKVRDRQSAAFALVSAAVALHIQGGVIRTAKVVAGGVGTVPWRLPEVERRLVGERPSPGLWARAAEVAAEGARPLRHNAFKAELLKRSVERQLRALGGTE
ncbi:FAD binding domain-containing protein [Streptomyces sp. 4F14]|uniref:FAD binding domain-containing protein n=1 Tax=Streptomyces sp. 4F14 TaxID=3394380 RepID=UPI003A8749F0